ncbi:MAG TPA: sorbosone dehydrogenase family protein [Methyloceanibacter sp.]|nr:sorbosone dehydrogenase family protein [Methyloceanibacter sp.]
MSVVARAICLWLLTLSVAACDVAELPEEATQGPEPTIPPPSEALIPAINIAPAGSWQQGRTPVAAEGLAVNAFAAGLDHPRWLYVLPNGDVLVAETNAPGNGMPTSFKGLMIVWAMGLAGAGVPSPNRIILLRDADGDGLAETRSVFLDGLNSPFGMALIGDKLYVAETDALLRFDYVEGATELEGDGVKVADLPGGPLNYHWTKSLVASPDGSRLYVGVGSNSNAGENGLEVERERARIVEIDPITGETRSFATGLRNPVGLAFEPETGALWAVVNERDELGSDLVPDYLTEVKEGAFYGWPFSYWGQHVDPRPKPQNPELVARAIAPDYALGNHVAALGLAFAKGNLLPEAYRSGAFIGEHGSWNRIPFSGYKVVFVPFAGGRPTGQPADVLTGFLSERGEAQGRPAGVAIDREGALLVADDVGNVVWRVAPAAAGR